MAPLLLASLVLALDAPITQVTVFTDQARVTRTASVPVSGVQSFELPTLPDTIDVSSLRVEATGAEVRRVDIERLAPEVVRTEVARALLSEIEKIDLELNRVSQERNVALARRDALLRLTPVAPRDEPLKPASKLNGSGWAQSQAFVAEQVTKAQTSVREADAKLKKLNEAREPLAERARKLGNPEYRSGWKIVALLSGNGPTTLTCTYLVRNAQWTPTWDLQLQPDKNVVSLSLAGMVAQNTTEDWTATTLNLSTAIPSSAVKVPELASWKIGVTDRFIPTARPMVEQIVPPPQAPSQQSLRQEVDVLRSQLASLDSTGNGQDKRRAYKAEPMQPSGMPPPAPPPASPAPRRKEAKEAESDSYGFSGANSPEELYVVDGVPASVEVASTVTGSVVGGRISGERPVATRSYSLSPPPSWRPPNYGPDSPVTLAAGYDLAFAALQKETIPTARGARRVALWSAQWPVSVERKLYPALTKDAFLVAELKNPSQQVLPGGPAQLSVGADPAGIARLKLVSPGEAFTLPLGIDRALKPVRNVQLVEATQGIISKDEIGTYTVTIELANPYPTPIAVRVYDQWPLSNQKEVEIKLVDSKPAATQDAKRGSLEWRTTIAAQQKTQFTFSYTIKRPRGWQLQSTEVAP